jgi:hypothetical protein
MMFRNSKRHNQSRKGGRFHHKIAHFLLGPSSLHGVVGFLTEVAPSRAIRTIYTTCPHFAGRWNSRLDRRDRQYLQRGQNWADFEDELIFDEPYPPSVYRKPEPREEELYQDPKQASYPSSGSKVQSSKQKPSYGVETGTPDSLVPDDWNERQGRKW